MSALLAMDRRDTIGLVHRTDRGDTLLYVVTEVVRDLSSIGRTDTVSVGGT